MRAIWTSNCVMHALLPTQQGRTRRAESRCRMHAAGPCRAAFMLTGPDGNSMQFDQETVTIGRSSTADVRLEAPNIGAEHAQISQRNGRTFCTALQGDQEDLSSSTHTWVDSTEIRQGVAYVVASGAKLAFGQPGNVFEVSFEEQASGSSAIFETLLRGMTMGASEDVKRQIQDTLGD